MATTATSRVAQQTTCPPTLFRAFELGVHPWQLGGPPGAAPRPREWHVPAGDGPAVLEAIRRAQSRCGFPAEARGGRGDAAGREGLWRPRFCGRQGRAPAVVAAARRAVPRRARRAKPARLEVPPRRPRRLRQAAGAKQGWSGVRGPSVAEEARRPRPRALRPPKRDRTRVRHRLTGLLAGWGLRLGWPGEEAAQREEGRPWEGAPRPAA
jgi:hypothetical protein